MKTLLTPCMSCKYMSICIQSEDSQSEPKLCKHGYYNFVGDGSDEASVKRQQELWEQKRPLLPDAWEFDFEKFGKVIPCTLYYPHLCNKNDNLNDRHYAIGGTDVD